MPTIRSMLFHHEASSSSFHVSASLDFISWSSNASDGGRHPWPRRPVARFTVPALALKTISLIGAQRGTCPRRPCGLRILSPRWWSYTVKCLTIRRYTAANLEKRSGRWGEVYRRLRAYASPYSANSPPLRFLKAAHGRTRQ